jgi:pimeloyl-ACP methyl ester carboxylesterase
MMAAMERIDYDEFGLFHENASEYGLAWSGPPMVRRASVELEGGRQVSSLVWGDTEPELVLIHGGAQNAHTWDTVALALGRSVVAVDLPGHGHSSWRDDGAYAPENMAADVAVAIEQLAPAAKGLVGMSLGGLTSFALAAARPDLVRRLVVVDVTPGTTREKAKAIIDFVSGPQSFPSFDELLQRTMEHNPTRSESSLRRGILHNAHQREDGSWAWNYDRVNRPPVASDGTPSPSEEDRLDNGRLWDAVAAVRAPLLLVRGSLSPVVDDGDVAELLRRQPGAEVVVVDGAGHSIQGDKPVELAALIERFVLDQR